MQEPAGHGIVRPACHQNTPAPSGALAAMDTPLLLLGAGQLALTFAMGYIIHLMRRDSKRSSLVALVTVLNELREKNGKALAAFFTLMSSEDFKHGDEQLRAGLIDSASRLRAIQATVTEALLEALRRCDAEWRLAGRLHAAFRSQITAAADKDWEKLLTQTPAVARS